MMQRREFLKGMAAASLAASLPQFVYAAPGSADAYRRLLILVELKGANDGLNTVVPYADAEYYRLRPRIALRREEVLQLSEREGLHPSLAALMPLWQAKELAVVQGVGYPDPNLSHFRSIEIWDTASASNQYLQQGWLARAFKASPVPSGFAADAVVVGNADLGPFTGGARTVALTNTEQFLRQARLATPGHARGNRALDHILSIEDEVVQAARGLGGGAALNTSFPQGPFGNAVRTAASVLAGKEPVAAIRLTLNGFDTHQNQPGLHGALLRQLGEGLASLKAALIELGRWDSTLIMTYAEFGRRAQENASNGTDHGTANAHFVMGGRVRGGLYGQAPRLDQLDNGNLVHAVDFRSLYATALQNWWGVSAAPALGGRFAPLDLVRA
jgi:uncharacterized protein (DUF1501 family)